TARPATLPEWIDASAHNEDDVAISTLPSGTVVVLEDPDRLRRLDGWIKCETLQAKLLTHFGMIYRHWIPDRRIIVNAAEALAVDPLFLMEHGRFYAETPARAIQVEARTIEVEAPNGETGRISIRASVLPPNFQLVDPATYGRKGAKVSKNRWDIMRHQN